MRFDRLLGACVLAVLVAVPALAPADDSRSDRARAQLDALRDRIDQVRHEIAADSHKRGKLSDALAAAQTQISAAQKRLDAMDASIADHKRRLVSLTDKRDAERDHLQSQLDTLRAQVRAAYKTGQINRMRLLLSGESPTRVGRMLAYYRYFADAQTGQIKHLQTALAALAQRQRALENERDALADERAGRAATLDDLEADRKQQRATIAALDARLSKHKNSLADMRADERQLEHLLDSVQNQLSGLPPVVHGAPFYKLKGRMHPPVSGPVIAHYGALKSGGPLRWQGEWLGASDGTPIKAVADGRVVYVGYMKRYGLIVILDHGSGYYTLYGHAQSSYVDVGDAVRAGQPIATAGHSGGHSESGAYFEIRKGSTPVNPASWLAG